MAKFRVMTGKEAAELARQARRKEAIRKARHRKAAAPEYAERPAGRVARLLGKLGR